jgi:hypothetical protein
MERDKEEVSWNGDSECLLSSIWSDSVRAKRRAAINAGILDRVALANGGSPDAYD